MPYNYLIDPKLRNTVCDVEWCATAARRPCHRPTPRHAPPGNRLSFYSTRLTTWCVACSRLDPVHWRLHIRTDLTCDNMLKPPRKAFAPTRRHST